MPILHKYIDQSGYYIKTNIKGNLVTFQLTKEGLSRLLQAGCDDKRKFPIQMLLDLVRDGGAYTEGSGVSPVSDPKQMEFDFAPIPEIEDLFPRCGKCKSYDNLRLVVQGETVGLGTEILCKKCTENYPNLQLNVPVAILNHKILDLLIEQQKIAQEEGAILFLRRWFAAEMSRFWGEYSNQKKDRQTSFGFLDKEKLF